MEKIGAENLNDLTNPAGTSIVDQYILWPFVKIHFEDQQVQSPIDILDRNSYDLNVTSLLYYDYWRNESVLIRIINNGQARKNNLLIFYQVIKLIFFFGQPTYHMLI